MVDPLFISVTDDVRALARDVVDDDFDDPAIVKEQKAAYAKIGIATGKWDWDASDTKRFPAIQKIEQKLAASYLIEYYGSGTAEEIAVIKSLRDAVKEDLTEIIAQSTDLTSTDDTLLILTSLFESYPASLQDDMNAIPHRSTTVSV